MTNFISRIFGQRDERNIVLVFVDAENSTIEPGLILETVETEFGKPRVMQAYSKWSGNPELRTNPIHKYRNAGFQTITCDTGSNNADIELSVEAVDMMHDFGNRGKRTLIICADGDRGFAHVFDKARKLGWESVLIANEKRGTLSDILRNSADRVISPDVSPDKPVKAETQITEKTGDKEQTDFQEIDRQWNEKVGEGMTINNSEAAKIANKIMNVPKLKNTPYKNLTGLIEKSDLLARNWVRDGQYETKRNIVDNSALATLTPDFQEIDRQWNEKAGGNTAIHTSVAGQIANKIMKAPKLKATQYKNLAGLIEKSDLLARNWERGGQYEIKKKGVDNAALARLTPSVIPESDTQRIPGFNTTSSKGRYSFRFPANPKELAKLITLVDSQRDEEINWSDLNAKIVEEMVVAKHRTYTFLSIIKRIGNENSKGEINWNSVKEPLDLTLVLKDEIINRFNKKGKLDDGNIPEIEKYFEQVSDEILSLKKK